MVATFLVVACICLLTMRAVSARVARKAMTLTTATLTMAAACIQTVVRLFVFTSTVRDVSINSSENLLSVIENNDCKVKSQVKNSYLAVEF
jgi:hypothetical protein